MSTELTTKPSYGIDVAPLDAAQRYGKLLAASGYFTDAADLAKAAVKILMGAELGISPVAAMSGINIIQGRPSISPALLAGCVRRSGLGRIDVVESTAQHCILQAYRLEGTQWTTCEPITFTMQDAANAKLATKDVWKAYPQDMLYKMALARVCRRYFQDVFIGVGGSVYSPGEIPEAMDVTPKPQIHVAEAAPADIKAKAQSLNEKLKAKREKAAEFEISPEITDEAINAVFSQIEVTA